MHSFTRIPLAISVAFLFTVFSSCSHDSTTPPAGPSSTAKPAQSASEKIDVAVYAAASTRDVLQVLEPMYEHDHNVNLVFNFGSSGDLSKQIIAAAKADVFLSADEKEMDKVAAAKLIADGSRKSLLSNQLVVIEPADAPSIFTTPFTPTQLADAKVKRLSLGNVETVPAGKYAKAWLEKTNVWASVSDRVLPGVDVRAALAAVESAGAQAGIVYRTDAASSKKVRVVFAVPLDEGPKISYPVAAIAGRPTEKAARAFIDYLSSSDAKSMFERYGFVVLATAK